MKIKLVLPMLFLLLSVGLFSHAQPQQTFIDQLTKLEFSKMADIKGKFVLENANGEAYYLCSKPLLGFNTMIVQTKGTGRMVINAIANSTSPLPQNLEPVLDQLTRMAQILGTIIKDSNTDASLRPWLAKLPLIKRIIVFSAKDGSHSVSFYVNQNDVYMVAITTQN